MKEKSWRKPFPRFFSGKMANERVLARASGWAGNDNKQTRANECKSAQISEIALTGESDGPGALTAALSVQFNPNPSPT